LRKIIVDVEVSRVRIGTNRGSTEVDSGGVVSVSSSNNSRNEDPMVRNDDGAIAGTIVARVGIVMTYMPPSIIGEGYFTVIFKNETTGMAEKEKDIPESLYQSARQRYLLLHPTERYKCYYTSNNKWPFNVTKLCRKCGQLSGKRVTYHAIQAGDVQFVNKYNTISS